MAHETILLLSDFSKFEQYDKHTQSKYGYKYSDLIKIEQKFLKSLLETKYPRAKVVPSLVIMVYIHADFGKRRERDYKLVHRYSKDYFSLMGTDDWNVVCSVEDFLEFAKHI